MGCWKFNSPSQFPWIQSYAGKTLELSHARGPEKILNN